MAKSGSSTKGRTARARSGVSALLTIDALGALTVTAAITLVFLIVLLLSRAAAAPEMRTLTPMVTAGLLACTLILFRHWWKGRQTMEANRTRMAYLMEHDASTGLYNREGFLARLSTGEATRDDAGQVALVCIGLTRFDEIVNNLGETCAEQALAEVSRRLTAAFQSAVVIGRVSEDVFAVVYRASGQERLSLLSGRVNQLINMPIETVAGRISAGSALGVTFASLPLSDGAEVLRQGRLALAAARAAGGAIALFEPGMDASRAIRIAMEDELRGALKHGGLRMVYQPQINERGALIGVEALIRWESPERGAVPPSVFIPIAEACGLGDAIGQFALDRAFADSKRWPGLRVAVNVSPVQLRSAEFLVTATRLLKAHGVSASNLELEITEGVLMENNPVVLANLAALRKMGFHLALDDFGTGYSGLSYLSQFQVDKIKIDRSFVTPLGSRTDAAPIIRAITDLSDAVGVKVLAEGVETRLQLDTLREEGCKQAQGFYIGRPVPPSEIDAMVAEPERMARAA